MSFSSLEFVVEFLPVFLAIYYLIPKEWRNFPLLLGSVVFYAWGVWDAPWMLALLAFFVGFSYLMGLLIFYKRQWRRGLLAFSLTVIFGCLLGFKYSGIFMTAGALLPLGISFYSFQMAAYLTDVSRGILAAETSFFRFAAGMLCFPKLISGPLVNWGTFTKQLRRRVYRPGAFDLGLREFILGLGLKLLLADRLGSLWRSLGVIGYESISAPLAWLGLLAYTLQIYFDFYGYSKMAIGLGRMLGFSLPENFLYPYAARSMTEFWRRWHVTLSGWFREYVYIPLGGNRCGRMREIRNLFVVWTLTGLWHGSTVNFLLWGWFLFLLLLIEKLGFQRLLEKTHFLCHIYMFFAVLLSWMLFAIPQPEQLAVYAGRLVSTWDWAAPDFLRFCTQYGWILVAGLLFSMPAAGRLWRRLQCTPLGTAVLFLVFWLAIYCMAAGLNDPFLYFAF